MQVALKIWRYDPDTGERELRDYEIEAPEWACLLDVLDLIKDRVDGSLSYRKSCRKESRGSSSTLARSERTSASTSISSCS